MDIHEIPDGLVDHHGEAIPVRQSSYTFQIGGFEERVAREFAEKREKSLPTLQESLKIIEILVGAIAVEFASGSPFL